MKCIIKGILVLLILGGLFCFCSNLLSSGLPRWLGVETLLLQVDSPDQNYTASLIERSGGATTGFTRQIVLRSNSAIDRLFPNNTVVVSVDGKRDFKIKWRANRTLDIGIEPTARFHFKREEWHDVKIVYIPIWDVK
jgi:hypothetical protein